MCPWGGVIVIALRHAYVKRGVSVRGEWRKATGE